MDNTSGFYRKDNDQLLFAPNFVYGEAFELFRNNKNTYEYPVNGWKWFDSEEEARLEYNLPKPPEEKPVYFNPVAKPLSEIWNELNPPNS